MAVTVKEALEMEPLKNCYLAAGASGLERKISYIDEMEVPNILPWLKEEELLITTAYAIKDDEKALLKIIQGLYEANAAGIALKTKFFGELTPSILNMADKLGIPLIIIPAQIPFIDIMNPLMKRIVDNQNCKLEFTKRMNERFLNLQIDGESFDSICGVLSELLQCDAIVTYRNYEVLSFCSVSSKLKERWVGENSNGQLCLNSILAEQRFFHEEGKPVFLDEAYEVMVYPIKVRNRCQGYLFVLGNRGQLNDMSQIAVQQASVYAALEFSNKGLIEEREFYHDTHFFLDLINQNILSEQDAQKRARGLGWTSLPCRMTISDIDNFESFVQGKNEQDILNMKDEILEEYKTVLHKKTHSIFITNLSDRFYCLFPSSISKKEISSMLLDIQQRLKRKYKLTLTTGASNMIEYFHQFKSAHEDGKNTVGIGKKSGLPNPVFFSEDLQLEKLFLEMGNHAYFCEFSARLLNGLESYDQEHDSHLLETLEVLTKKDGARKETADTLYLHRNTLMYRLHQIEEITGYDLNSYEDIVKLTIAFGTKRYKE